MTYFRKLFILTFILITIPILFIFLVDPYSLTKMNLLKFKEKGIFDYRTNKFYKIETVKGYEAFIIGSSRATQLQPAIIKKTTGYATFNYSVLTGMPEDYLAITRHIIAKQHPQLIWLHLDFFALNKNMPVSSELYNSPLYNYLQKSNTVGNEKATSLKIYFSYSALKDAFLVVKKNMHNKIEIHMRETGESLPNTNTLSPNVKLLESYWEHEYKNYAISEDRINDLKMIKQICEKNHIKLYVSLSPVHSSHFDKIQQTENLVHQIPLVKKELTQIFGCYHDFFNAEAHPYLSESSYWQDSVHPTTPLGKKITEIMASSFVDQEQNLPFGKLQCTLP